MSDEPGRAQRPARLLTQNSQLKEIGVWNWTIPAWAGRFDDGTTYNTCPSAGICSKVCYARSGAYLWPQVRGKHQANLRFVLDDPDGFEEAMIAELGARRFHGKWIRVHDAGDFFSDDYTLRWMRIMRARPDSHFYAYTKELDRFRRLVSPDPPPNFLWTFSLGGTQDADLDPETDRMADVFPSEEAIAAAGWHSQLGDDRLAVLGEAPVGMSANRIPKFLNLLDGRRFSEWQAQENERRAAKKKRKTGSE